MVEKVSQGIFGFVLAYSAVTVTAAWIFADLTTVGIVVASFTVVDSE